MSLPDSDVVHASLREEIERPAQRFAPEHTLTRYVGEVLFENRWILPREIVADVALAHLRADTRDETETAEERVARYRAHVLDEAKRMAYAFEDWSDDPIADRFGKDLCAAFGVHDDLIAKLMVAFHEAETPDRLGILIELELAQGFHWITELIDNAEGGNPITIPLKALRKIVKQLPQRRRRRPPLERGR